MRRTLIAALLAAGFATPALAADDAVLAELKRLAARVEALEQQNKALEKALASERISDREPELATRLKATESQALAMQGPLKKLSEALEGIEVGGSLTSVVQRVGARDTASGTDETRASYRGDLTVTLPGGNGRQRRQDLHPLPLRPGHGHRPAPHLHQHRRTPRPSRPTPRVPTIPSPSWPRRGISSRCPLMDDGLKANARDHIYLTVGKIDPFVFFDQNAAADDESAKFMNNAFVHNPLLDSGGDIGADRYGFQPGAILKYENSSEKGGEWALSVGAFSSGTGANFSGANRSTFVIAQAEMNTRFNHLPGTYARLRLEQGTARRTTTACSGAIPDGARPPIRKCMRI
jgi:high affinity Mn2+ porin